MRRSLLAVALLSSAFAVIPLDAGVAAQPTAGAAIAYPQTRRVELVDTQFGVAVPDPYRWLETDVRNDPQVRAWVDSQNSVTNAFLAGLPGRAALEKRITELYDYER